MFPDLEPELYWEVIKQRELCQISHLGYLANLWMVIVLLCGKVEPRNQNGSREIYFAAHLRQARQSIN